MTDTARSSDELEGSDAKPSAGAADDTAVLRPYSDVEYVFAAGAPGLESARQYIGDVWDRRRFAMVLAKSELRGPRASTALGEVWSVLDPLFQAGIYWFLITVIRGGKGGASANNARLAMIMSGIFLFTFTSSAMGEGGRAIIRNKGLVLNSTFPRALLVASTMYKAILALIPAMVVYAGVHVLLGRPFGAGLFLLPLLFLLQLLISTGLALILAVLTVFVRDMTNILQYVMRVMLFATPILYQVTQLPNTVRTVLILNPVFNLFSAYQTVFNGGMPSTTDLFVTTAWAIILPLVGFRIFVARERAFAMRL